VFVSQTLRSIFGGNFLNLGQPSFNGKFLDVCLNEHWFESLPQARSTIAAWRQD